jgi:hypothetical protein
MSTLGFDKYVDPLRIYLTKYRDSVKGDRPEKKPSSRKDSGLVAQPKLMGMRQPYGFEEIPPGMGFLAEHNAPMMAPGKGEVYYNLHVLCPGLYQCHMFSIKVNKQNNVFEFGYLDIIVTLTFPYPPPSHPSSSSRSFLSPLSCEHQCIVFLLPLSALSRVLCPHPHTAPTSPLPSNSPSREWSDIPNIFSLPPPPPPIR